MMLKKILCYSTFFLNCQLRTIIQHAKNVSFLVLLVKEILNVSMPIFFFKAEVKLHSAVHSVCPCDLLFITIKQNLTGNRSHLNSKKKLFRIKGIWGMKINSLLLHPVNIVTSIRFICSCCTHNLVP